MSGWYCYSNPKLILTETLTNRMTQSSQKRVKTNEIGGLAKDWWGVYVQSMAMSSASSLGDPIELPAPVSIKAEKGLKRGKEADKVLNLI